jgi:hypothetical protein
MNSTTLPITDQIVSLVSHQASATENCRRKGKIARLPKATRDMLNQMLDDGLPYPVIIEELGEAGEGLNTQNLTNWKQGGYQDWVKMQEQLECAKAQVETATELLSKTGHVDVNKIYDACNHVAAAQLFETVMRHGEGALEKMLKQNPVTYIKLLSTIRNFAESGLRFAKVHQLERQQTAAAQAAPTASSQIKVNQA